MPALPVLSDPRFARLWHGAVAALVVLAIVMQVVIALQVSGPAPEVPTGVLRGTHAFGRVVRVFSFFTIQSNLLCGFAALTLALNPHRDGPIWRAVRLASLFGITVTGIVYSAVLADMYEPSSLGASIVNLIVHYIVPIMVVLGWFLFGPRPRIERRTVVWSLAFPVLWTIYTLIRGAAVHWYPYPFVDADTLGYGKVAVNAVLVVVLLAAVSGAFAYGDRRLRSTD
jgi:hypothetical protein